MFCFTSSDESEVFGVDDTIPNLQYFSGSMNFQYYSL